MEEAEAQVEEAEEASPGQAAAEAAAVGVFRAAAQAAVAAGVFRVAVQATAEAEAAQGSMPAITSRQKAAHRHQEETIIQSSRQEEVLYL